MVLFPYMKILCTAVLWFWYPGYAFNTPTPDELTLGAVPNCTRHVGKKCVECSDGLWGDSCQFSCSNKCEDGCDQQTGECRACSPGSYGPQCNNPCPPNCSPDLEDRVYCDKSTGTCKGDCKNRFWGTRCNKKCSSFCANLKCHFKTGTCIDGCVPHHFERTCQNMCINCTNHNCTDTGECLSGCKLAHFGKMCNQICSGCKQGDCDGNGTCTLGCVDGFAGPLCDVKCPDECTTCYKDRTCIQCRDGYTMCQYSTSSLFMIIFFPFFGFFLSIASALIMNCLLRYCQAPTSNSSGHIYVCVCVCVYVCVL